MADLWTVWHFLSVLRLILLFLHVKSYREVTQYSSHLVGGREEMMVNDTKNTTFALLMMVSWLYQLKFATLHKKLRIIIAVLVRALILTMRYTVVTFFIVLAYADYCYFRYRETRSTTYLTVWLRIFTMEMDAEDEQDSLDQIFFVLFSLIVCVVCFITLIALVTNS